MKRKDLLKFPLLKATPKMLAVAKEDKGTMRSRQYITDIWIPTYLWYYRAKKRDKDTLEISIFTYKSLKEEDKEPIYRVFLHKGKHYVFEPYTEKWRTAMIDNLEYSRGKCEEYYWYANRYVWMSEAEKRILISYTNNDCKEPRAAVQKWQKENKYRAEVDRIDSAMSLVPKLPNDYLWWVEKEGTRQYIFYDAGRNVKEGYCTHCEKTVPIKKPKYNLESFCPKCKHPVAYKSRKLSGRIRASEHVGLLQQTDEGYVYRYFDTLKIYQNGNRTDGGGCWETIRRMYNTEFHAVNEFEWTRFKNGAHRWCFRNTGSSYNVSEYRVKLYTKNLKQLLKGTKLQYSAIELFAKQGRRYKAFAPSLYIYEYFKKPAIEQLVKCGFINLADCCISNGKPSKLKTDEKSVKKIINLSAENYKLIADINPTFEEFVTLHNMEAAGVKVTKEQLKYLANVTKFEASRFLKYTTAHKLIRYIKEVLKEKRAEDYYDYLKMAEELKYNLHDSHILYPQNMIAAHDAAIEAINIKKSKVANAAERKKNREIKKLYQKYVQAYTFEDKEFIIRPIASLVELKMEGNTLHHCVSTYADRILEGTTIILVAREKQDSEKPLVTVEVRSGKLIQARGKYNHEPKKEMKKFIKKFEKQILTKSERKVS